MNEPKHIRDVVIRSLQARLRAVNLHVDELKAEKAAWHVIEETMNLRDELIKALENLQANE